MEKQTPEQRERLWRRKVSGAERAELRGDPELELEARLSEALAQLSDAPVPSNFTARVLAAIDAEEARSERSGVWRWNWHALLPRIAVATLVLLLAGLGLQQFQLARNHSVTPGGPRLVVSVTAVPTADALENLDAIQGMSRSARADTELLADLQ